MTGPPCDYALNHPAPRTMLDNAITAGFRAAIGWCPFRDDKDHRAGTPLPKESVRYDDIFGVVRAEKGGT